MINRVAFINKVDNFTEQEKNMQREVMEVIVKNLLFKNMEVPRVVPVMEYVMQRLREAGDKYKEQFPT